MNAVQYSGYIKEVVNVSLDRESYFEQEVLISEFGDFGYDVKIKGKAKIYEDKEVNAFDTEVEDFELDIESVYNEDGEILNLTNNELALIEDNLRNNIVFDFN